MSEDNVIPVMTHPLSVHWEQPEMKEVLIDDKHVHYVLQGDNFSCITTPPLPAGE